MSSRKLVALTLVALTLGGLAGLAAPAAAQGDVTARPDQRVQLDFRHYYTLDELDASLTALAAAYPEFLRLESMGRSAGGAELWVLTLTRLADGDPGLKPGLLLVGGLGEGDLWGTEMALFTALELVQNHRRDPRAREVLEHATIYLVPAANPDVRAAMFAAEGAGAPAPLPTLDGNFEIGWRPGVPGAGPYPLSSGEALALARFLLDHRNVAAVQAFSVGGARGTPAGLPRLSTHDRALHLELAQRASPKGGAELRGAPDLALSGGTLLEFALGHRGAFAFEFLPRQPSPDGRPGAVPDVDELFGLGRQSFGATLELGAALPRIELASREVTRVSLELWQLDLGVADTGFLPTLSDLGARRFAAGPPRIELEGGVLEAAAVDDGNGGYEVVPTRGQAFSLEELHGGAARGLRLVVRAAEGEPIAISAQAPRAGRARLELVLQ